MGSLIWYLYRCPRKKRKNLAYSDFALASYAQTSVLQMPHNLIIHTIGSSKQINGPFQLCFSVSVFL